MNSFTGLACGVLEAAADLGPAIALGLAGVGIGSAGLLLGVNSMRRAKKPPAP